MPSRLVIRGHIIKVKAKLAEFAHCKRCHIQTYQTCKYRVVPVQDVQDPCLYGPHILRPAVVEPVLACIAAELPVLPSTLYAVPAFQAS